MCTLGAAIMPILEAAWSPKHRDMARPGAFESANQARAGPRYTLLMQ